MEIKFDIFTLADGDDATGLAPSGPSGLTIDGSRAVQVDEFIRGEHPALRDRGNKTTSISFSVTRHHKSYGEAEMFCLEHAEQLPVIGRLIIRGRGELGGPLQRQCDAAALVSVRSSHTGVSTTHTYQFMAGELKKAKVTT